MSRRRGSRGEPDRAGRRHRPTRGRGWVVGASLLVIVAALLVAGMLRFAGEENGDERIRSAAGLALKAMRNGDLDGLERKLSSHRGEKDFAYYFTVGASPRELGDAVATFADA